MASQRESVAHVSSNRSRMEDSTSIEVIATTPPIADLSVDQVDKMIAAEMNNLSVRDRDRIFEDLHGVSDIEEETPEFVSCCVSNLEACIDSLLVDDCAYVRALEQDQEFVTNLDFRLMFLRSSNFNARQAAERMLLHFFYKEELFGTEKLTKDITLSDLNSSCTDFLYEQAAQILPNRDRSGRCVVICGPPYCFELPWKQLVRPYWYLTMSMLQDIEIQKRGLVAVSFVSSEAPQPGECVRRHIAGVQLALPTRIVAQHVCTHDPKIGAEFQKMRYYMEKSLRWRFRFHLGSQLEIQQRLRGFGIPICSFEVPFPAERTMLQNAIKWQFMRLCANITRPRGRLISTGSSLIGDNGTISDSSHVDTSIVVNHAKATKAPSKSTSICDTRSIRELIQEISPKDVICARGKDAWYHPGNIRMRSIVEEYQNNYHHAYKTDKTKIVKHVIQLIREDGGRFLKRAMDVLHDDECDGSLVGKWIEINDAAAHEKISKVFRRSSS